MKKGCVIYARVSTDRQERGTSLQTQVERCSRYAENHDLDVVEIFEETYSGAARERPQLDRVREIIRSDRISTLLIYDLDRLARDPLTYLEIEDLCKTHEVSLESVTGGALNGDTGELLGIIRAGIGRFERNQIKERTIRGKKAALERGRVLVHGANVPYGYRSEGEKGDRRLVENPEEADVVRLIFELSSQGQSLQKIADELNKKGIPPRRSRQWMSSSINLILHRDAYNTGLWQYGKSKYVKGKQVKRTEKPPYPPVPIPKIVEDGIFKKARQKMSLNRGRARKMKAGTKNYYILSGMVQCRCGRSGVGTSTRDRKRNPVRYYRCTSFTKASSPQRCEYAETYLAKRLETLVLLGMLERLKNPKATREWAKREKDQLSESQSALEKDAATFEKEAQKFRRKLERLGDEYIDGLLTPEQVSKRRENLQSQLDYNESQLYALSIKKPEWTLADVEKGRRDLLEYLTAHVDPSMNLREAQRWMDAFPIEEEREIDGEEITITYLPKEDLRRILQEAKVHVTLLGKEKKGRENPKFAEVSFELAPGAVQNFTVEMPVGKLPKK